MEIELQEASIVSELSEIPEQNVGLAVQSRRLEAIRLEFRGIVPTVSPTL